MGIDEVDRTVVTTEPATGAAPATTYAERHLTRTTGPGGSEFARRVIVLVFGLIQIVIALRIVLLVLDARQANGLVSAILDVSQVFVAPFNGILNTDALHAGGSMLDVAAVLALVGWTVLELIVIWAVGIFRRGPASYNA